MRWGNLWQTQLFRFFLAETKRMLHVSSTFGWPCYISIFGISSDGVTSNSPVIIFPWGITQPTGRWTLGQATSHWLRLMSLKRPTVSYFDKVVNYKPIIKQIIEFFNSRLLYIEGHTPFHLLKTHLAYVFPPNVLHPHLSGEDWSHPKEKLHPA